LEHDELPEGPAYDEVVGEGAENHENEIITEAQMEQMMEETDHIV